MVDKYIHIIDMPTTIPAMTVENRDGSYTILINARLSQAGQMRALKHEQAHLRNRDFEREDSADKIEAERHKKEGR